MKVKKGIKIFLLVILILAFIGVTGLLVFKISKTFFGTVVNKEPVIVNSIDGYGYSLSNNMGDEYNKMFNELKDVLNSDTVNDKDYAS